MNAYCPSASETDAPTLQNAADSAEDAGRESMNLSGNTLENPCLDYNIQNIIFSPPDATFTAGNTTFTDFASVREAFLSGAISEKQLKQGLIDELNRLLESVRNHFTTDVRAKDLLVKVQQYKKEALAVEAERAIRRLNLIELGRVKYGSHLVFAPLPIASPTLQQAVDLLHQLRQGGDDSAPRVLYLYD
ncbi:hypothetical protein ACA910_011735 [Epithemia clementina (nom. ined.)]